MSWNWGKDAYTPCALMWYSLNMFGLIWVAVVDWSCKHSNMFKQIDINWPNLTKYQIQVQVNVFLFTWLKCVDSLVDLYNVEPAMWNLQNLRYLHILELHMGWISKSLRLLQPRRWRSFLLTLLKADLHRFLTHFHAFPVVQKVGEWAIGFWWRLSAVLDLAMPTSHKVMV
jgi:hypothetical protein